MKLYRFILFYYFSLFVFRFTCLFCEKEFKEWSILKDHMRKKGHKRLDPKNKDYDKYYVINYLVSGGGLLVFTNINSLYLFIYMLFNVDTCFFYF